MCLITEGGQPRPFWIDGKFIDRSEARYNARRMSDDDDDLECPSCDERCDWVCECNNCGHNYCRHCAKEDWLSGSLPGGELYICPNCGRSKSD